MSWRKASHDRQSAKQKSISGRSHQTITTCPLLLRVERCILDQTQGSQPACPDRRALCVHIQILRTPLHSRLVLGMCCPPRSTIPACRGLNSQS